VQKAAEASERIVHKAEHVEESSKAHTGFGSQQEDRAESGNNSGDFSGLLSRIVQKAEACRGV
jgi:hypothetical protein